MTLGKEKIGFAISLLVLWPASIEAQVATPPPDTQPRPHQCGSRWVPKDLTNSSIEGVTTLAFHITEEGNVSDIEIRQSSGNDELDVAAKHCAETWKYRPAMRNGKPIEVAWQAKVSWFYPKFEIVRDCPFSSTPTSQHLSAERSVVLSFDIEPDGSVKNVSINRSSNDKELDAAAVTCLTARVYKPVIANGSPIAVTTETSLNWAPAASQATGGALLVTTDDAAAGERLPH